MTDQQFEAMMDEQRQQTEYLRQIIELTALASITMTYISYGTNMTGPREQLQKKIEKITG